MELLRAAMRLQNLTRGAVGSELRLVLLDTVGAMRGLTLVRSAIPGEAVKYGNMPVVMARTSWARVPHAGGCSGVLRFNTWMPAVAPAIDAAVDSLRGCSGIVIDLRGNTGGVLTMVIGVAGHFFATRDTLAVMRTRTAPLHLVANPRTSNARGERVRPFAGPLAILVDEITGSTSEVFAGSLQSLGRARIFGDTTAGQTLPATTQRLPTGDILMFAVADLRGPRGERVEGNGVVPDELVRLQQADLIARRDAPLERALQWLSSPTSR
jgi:carboxyl-terminal processing protease